VALPLAAFAFAFFIAAITASATVVWTSGFLGLAAAGAIFALCCLVEYHLLGNVNGALSTPVLLALSICVPALGHFLYTRKEGISRPTPLRQGRWWIAVLAVVAAFILLSAFVASFRHVGRMSPPPAPNVNQSRFENPDRIAVPAKECEPGEAISTQPTTAPNERSR
jgi:hypothetical protein